jgi:ceramide glucosyltransferase
MVDVVRFVEAFCAVAAILHWTSILIVGVRARMKPSLTLPADLPGVSIVRPVCGLENHIEETLRSAFTLTYPRYELVFCVASERDPVIPLVERLIAAHRQVPARLLVGDDQVSINPKLNNVAKGWEAAAYDWIAMADSNVLMPRDYIEALLGRADPETAIVSAPPVGARPEGAWAELECAFLNTYQARWQLAADAVGLGFAHGKNMFWRREVLDDAGGIRALAAEPAEDAAGTKIARAAGMKVRLVTRPFPQPLGRRSLGEVWRRQLRWARLRRASFKGFFLPEILSGGFLPLLGVAFLVGANALPPLPALAGVAAWYGAESALAFALGWPLSWRAPFLAVMRDVMLPCLWLGAVTGNEFVWRGNAMNIEKAEESAGGLQLAEEEATR